MNTPMRTPTQQLASLAAERRFKTRSGLWSACGAWRIGPARVR